MHYETLRDDALEFGDVDATARVPIIHERDIAERVTAIEVGDVAKVSCIDARENERRKRKVHYRSIRKACGYASDTSK